MATSDSQNSSDLEGFIGLDVRSLFLLLRFFMVLMVTRLFVGTPLA